MGKPSPGPWEYRPAKNASSGAGMVHSADGEEVTVGHCGCCFPGDEHCSTADGRLIAEAPTMLELLRRWLSAAEFPEIEYGGPTEVTRCAQDTNALLAKLEAP